MAHTNAESDDASAMFWPGYVDAISNLVLNLLFLVMILCLAIFVLSQSTHHTSQARQGAQSPVRHETRHVEAQPQQDSQLGSGGTTAVVQKRAEIEVRPSPQSKLAGAVHIKGYRVSDQGVYLEVHYLEDALDLTPATQLELREHLVPLIKAGFSEWDLVVSTDTAYASLRRHALLRVLRVREAMQSLDMPELKSNTRMESGGSVASTTVVRLYGRRPVDLPTTLPNPMFVQ
jgi:hypothetical protein